MMMKKIFALILSLMLLALPCLALAEEAAVIGGADAPTEIVITETAAPAEEAGETAEAEETVETEEDVKPLSLLESLVYMAKGLVGIFLVTGMIILVLRILEKATAKKEESEQ